MIIPIFMGNWGSNGKSIATVGVPNHNFVAEISMKIDFPKIQAFSIRSPNHLLTKFNGLFISIQIACVVNNVFPVSRYQKS